LSAASTLLYVESLIVSFDGFLALRNLNLIVDRTERVRILIGPNGAGKTTLFDVLTGHVTPVSGRVLFRDTLSLLGKSPHAIANLGVMRKFQTPSVFPGHTVFENMILSVGNKRFSETLATGRRAIHSDEIAASLDHVGLLGQSHELAGRLSHGQKQWLELAMLLVQAPPLLLLDEPVAGMTKPEKEKTAELLKTIVERSSSNIMLIEHDMDFVRTIAGHGHRVTVLHEGTVLAEGPLERVQADQRVVKAYLGRGRVRTET